MEVTPALCGDLQLLRSAHALFYVPAEETEAPATGLCSGLNRLSGM
jgi:hypothetical protein